jgi:hypothetical protein
MKKRRGVAAKITATLILALGGFTLAAVISGVGFASGETTTDSTSTATDTTPTTTTTPPEEGEGCTPGFWKQEQHFEFWEGFAPTDTLGSVFDPAALAAADVDPDVTLLEALQTGGGGVDALLRQAVAALLNASSSAVDFDFTVGEVIDLVNDALASGDPDVIEDLKDQFDEANNQGSEICD